MNRHSLMRSFLRRAKIREAPFALPYAAIVISYALVIAAALTGQSVAVTVGAAAALALTVLIVFRQVQALNETRGLREQTAVLEETLRRHEARFRSLAQNASDVIAIVDAEGTVVHQSRAGKQILGYTPEVLFGANGLTAVHSDDVDRAERLKAELLRSPGQVQTASLRFRDAAGDWRMLEVSATNLLDDPVVKGIVINARDISERLQLEERLTHQAFHDSMTGLANRALFRDRVQHALARRQRRGDPMAVLLLDLDGFKTINDSLGHTVGDYVLTAVAERLRGSLRVADTAARLGGDEFAILLEDLPERGYAVGVADRVIESFQVPFNVQGKEIHVRASIGVVITDTMQGSADDLIRNADLAMYEAKSKGKGRYALFETRMHEAVLRRIELEDELRQGIVRGELVLRYQPIVDLRTHAIAGAEALVGWQHPRRGLIAPSEFVPLAEAAGMVVSIDRWVLHQASRQCRYWQQRYQTGVPLLISINLSSRNFQQPGLVDAVADAYRRARLAPETLVLEITENALIEDLETTRRKLEALKALSVRIAIDDFGTGYSSLRYLEWLPIDMIKLHRSFVEGLHEDSDRSSLASAAIKMGHELGLTVVAEGIETASQLNRLKALDCQLGQGFLFCHPLPPDEMRSALEEGLGKIAWPLLEATPASPVP